MISVVISLFNKEKYIARAIDSVLNQTYRDFELIIVNDGSTDGSVEIVKSYNDPRIRLICQPNGGESAARNKGIENSKSDMIAFLDADDEYRPGFLEKIINLRKEFPNAGAYATAYEVQYSAQNICVPKFKAIPHGAWEGYLPNYFESALGPSPVWSSAVSIPKSVFDRIGTFLPVMQRGVDLHMWLRIALKYPIVFSSFIGSRYYCDAEGRMCEKGGSSAAALIKNVIEEELKAKKIKPEFVLHLKRYEDLLYLKTIYDLISKGNITHAKTLLRQYKTGSFFALRYKLKLMAYSPPFLMAAAKKIRAKLR